MTIYLKSREPIHQARQYDPAWSESQPHSLEAWIQGAVPSSVPLDITVTADSTGFTIVVDTGVDGIQTATGGVGDWIVMHHGSLYPTVVSPADLARFYYDAAE